MNSNPTTLRPATAAPFHGWEVGDIFPKALKIDRPRRTANLAAAYAAHRALRTRADHDRAYCLNRAPLVRIPHI